MNRLITGLLCAAATGLSLPAWPADTVTDALQQAYEPYRTALFRTNGKVQAEAEQAVTRAQQAWLAFGQQVDLTGRGAGAHEVTRTDLGRVGRIAGDDLPLLTTDDGLHLGAIEVDRLVAFL